MGELDSQLRTTLRNEISDYFSLSRSVYACTSDRLHPSLWKSIDNKLNDKIWLQFKIRISNSLEKYIEVMNG